MTKADYNRRWIEKVGKESINENARHKYADYRAANPIAPKVLVEKIKKSCAHCGKEFEVFPCLDRIQCCSRKCSAQVKAEKIRGSQLPEIRACKCGKVEKLKRSKCSDCRKLSLSESYHRNKVKWTDEQREIRRQCSYRAKTKLRSTPEGKRRHNMFGRESESRRRAQMKATTVGRVSYQKILREFGMICNICTGSIADGDLSFDHVIPLVRGGSHTQENIRPAHLFCNKRKNRRLPEEVVCLSKAWQQN